MMEYPFPSFTRQAVTLPAETLPEIVERHYAEQCQRQSVTLVIDERAWQVIMWDYLPPAAPPSGSPNVIPLDASAIAARSAERVRANRERRREVAARQSEGLDDLV